jgi:hypothetical protein
MATTAKASQEQGEPFDVVLTCYGMAALSAQQVAYTDRFLLRVHRRNVPCSWRLASD